MTLSRRSSGASKSVEKRRQISLVFCGSFWTCTWWLQQQPPEEAGKQLAYKCKYSLTSLFLLKLLPACFPSPKGDTNRFLSLAGHHPSQNLSTAYTCVVVTGSREAQSSSMVPMSTDAHKQNRRRPINELCTQMFFFLAVRFATLSRSSTKAPILGRPANCCEGKRWHKEECKQKHGQRADLSFWKATSTCGNRLTSSRMKEFPADSSSCSLQLDLRSNEHCALRSIRHLTLPRARSLAPSRT